MRSVHPPDSDFSSDRHKRLSHLVDHLAHLLPVQGPIGVFIHHNTLHAFQHLPFEKAVVDAGRLFGTEPYMREEAFRQEIKRGRIRREDIAAILNQEANAPILSGRLDRRSLRQAMLVPGVQEVDAATIEWHLEEGGLLTAFREDLEPEARQRLGTGGAGVRNLFLHCLRRVEDSDTPEPSMSLRPRDGLLDATGVDLDDIIHPLLIRLAGAFLDQGLAYWPMPERERGFWGATRALLMQPMALLPEHLHGLGALLRQQDTAAQNPESAVLEALDQFGVVEEEWEGVIRAELLALPGWAGLLRRLEEEPGLAPHDRVPCSLMEFLAVRLTMTLAAAMSLTSDLSGWRAVLLKDMRVERLVAAARLFDVAQLVGLSAAELTSLDASQSARLWQEIEAFHGLERRRVLQLAYERRHERQVLLPLAQHVQRQQAAQAEWQSQSFSAQVFFCIDEREESIRRHLEEIDPTIETFGAAGFFGVAVDYQGIDDAHGVPLCPVVVKPQHAVREQPVQQDEHLHNKRRSLRRLWAKVARNGFISSRTLVRGSLSTAGLGLLSIFPLAALVLTPRAYAQLCNRLNRGILPEPRTELTLMRTDAEGHNLAEGLLLGFSVDEKVERVASVLGPAGLRRGLARIVIVLGHGSTSLNNPHESAHDCGACGGRRGGPNARLFAAMANHPAVREGLRGRGIHIPEDTWFVGGYHDTCNDNIDFFDLEAVPSTHYGDLARVRTSLDQARAWGAHERVRRFEAARLDLHPDAALRHVQERAEHLGEPRPEYGHCTNAVCIVGRRSTTRGLFLDRRAFLVSYDATLDPDNDSLGRLLGAVIPVCAGINLEYYFSFVDNEGYGCGTKLPHNVTGLVGIMNGHASDLRTGLPWQMVEIHEPVRILFVLETTPERALSTIRKSPALTEFLENRWIRLATLDPIDGTIQAYRDGVFNPVEGDDEGLPVAASSMDYYRGKREHLPLAHIQPEPAVRR